MSNTAPKLLVMGNWTMNPPTIGSAKELMLDIRKGIGRHKSEVEVVVAPPTVYLPEMERITPSQRILLGAQDVHSEKSGPHTGEVSLSMLESVGVSHIIIGHSERRAAGETDLEIYKNVQTVLKGKAVAVVCVGETHRDAHGNYFGVVEAQLRAALRDVKPMCLKYLTIAYEPVWAIGTGETATPEDAHEMRLFIQKILMDRFGRSALKKVRILYGGSVKPQNAEALLQEGEVDGFLIGGASLKAKDFTEIVKIGERYVKNNPS